MAKESDEVADDSTVERKTVWEDPSWNQHIIDDLRFFQALENQWILIVLQVKHCVNYEDHDYNCENLLLVFGDKEDQHLKALYYIASTNS